MKNIYYFKVISAIGGIETFFYQIAKKYQDRDITIVYDYADYKQLKRLKKYVRCIKNVGQHFECDKVFFNFNTDIIDNVEAKEYNLVIHGNYKFLPKSTIPRHPKINNYYAVSKDSADAFTELTGLKCEVAYNPIEKEEVEKPLILVTASRLADPVKGANNLKELIRVADEYSEETGRKYIMFIFTKNFNAIKSKNVVYMESTLDILPYMKMADYVVQLSDNFEGYNYTVNESLYINKVPVIITPCDVYKELGIDDTMSIKLDFDLGNIKQVVKDMFTKKLKVNYEPPKDRWGDIFAKGKSTYDKEENMKVIVRATKNFKLYNVNPKELNYVPEEGTEFEIEEERLQDLLGNNAFGVKFVDVVETAKETAGLVKKDTKKKIVRK